MPTTKRQSLIECLKSEIMDIFFINKKKQIRILIFLFVFVFVSLKTYNVQPLHAAIKYSIYASNQ